MIRDDSVGIPLCFSCHSIFHKRGERLYWEEINIDPIHYAKELWEEYNETRKLERNGIYSYVTIQIKWI